MTQSTNLMTDTLKQLNQTQYANNTHQNIGRESHVRKLGLDDFITLADAQSTWCVLDVATGNGDTSLALAPQVAQVVTIDLTESILQTANQQFAEKEQSNIRLSVADSELLPFAENSFDCVVCRVGAQHFPNVFSFMREAYRVLRPDGILLIQDQVMPEDERMQRYINAFEKLLNPFHSRALSEFEWRGMFLDAGFKMTHVEQHTFEYQLQSWIDHQNYDEVTRQRLHIMLMRAPKKVTQWMQVRHAGTDQAQYTSHHIMIRGQKVHHG